MDESEREMRLSSMTRGTIIAAAIAAYTWVSIADGVTVLLFALGVFGGILRAASIA